MATRAIQDAETRLSEVIRGGEQRWTAVSWAARGGARGGSFAGRVPVFEYTGCECGATGLPEFLLSGPKFDEFELERDRDTGRVIEL